MVNCLTAIIDGWHMTIITIYHISTSLHHKNPTEGVGFITLGLQNWCQPPAVHGHGTMSGEASLLTWGTLTMDKLADEPASCTMVYDYELCV